MAGFGKLNLKTTNITTNATTLVLSGPGYLEGITINIKGATANTIKIYDGIDNTGVLIATIDSTSAVGTLFYERGVNTGICVVTASGTAPDMTVLFAPGA